MVVDSTAFNADEDTNTRILPLVQEVNYGGAGWFGAVTSTQVTIDNPGHHLRQENVPVAVACEETTGGFFGAQGIVGLAFSALDNAYDVSELITAPLTTIEGDVTWLSLADHPSLKQINAQLRQLPRQHLTPYFSALEQHGVVADQFALYTHRCCVYHAESDDDTASHPLNQGLFIIGQPHHHSDLYEPPFIDIPLQDDVYYNLHLTAISVGEQPLIPVPVLTELERKSCRSNAIVDSGASSIVLPESVYQAFATSLEQEVPGCHSLIEPFARYDGQEKGIALTLLDLPQWPDVHFHFGGMHGQDVRLTVPATLYWQVHAPARNQATFTFCTLPGWPNQVILGLPLLNNYYTVFDRLIGERGAVRFASKTDNRNRDI